jgi:enolase
VAAIAALLAWEALDSRGTPTVACVVTLDDGAEGVAAVPSGASTGTHEAHERRDGDERYEGRGVRGAVSVLDDEIAPALLGRDASEQEVLDELLVRLDGTPSLERLGANAVLAASVAVALADAAYVGQPLWRRLAPDDPPLLPLPMVNVLSGGAHAGGAIDIQDVLVVPLGATSFAQAIEWAARARSGAAAELERRGHGTALVADEGGLAAPLRSNREALEVVCRGIERAGLTPGVDAALAVDIAATQLLQPSGRYRLASEGRDLEAAALVSELVAWADAFPLVSIEDALAEDDSDGWLEATRVLGSRCQLLGDDLFVTSPTRLADGIARGLANAVLVKPNQIGTLTGAARAIAVARDGGYRTVLSARSGETEDAWLADLAVGWRTGQLKVGSTTRSERTAKWNRLLRIEAERPDAVFAGQAALMAGAGRPGS